MPLDKTKYDSCVPVRAESHLLGRLHPPPHDLQRIRHELPGQPRDRSAREVCQTSTPRIVLSLSPENIFSCNLGREHQRDCGYLRLVILGKVELERLVGEEGGAGVDHDSAHGRREAGVEGVEPLLPINAP